MDEVLDWTDDDQELAADAAPPEIVELPASDPAGLPPDAGNLVPPELLEAEAEHAGPPVPQTHDADAASPGTPDADPFEIDVPPDLPPSADPGSGGGGGGGGSVSGLSTAQRLEARRIAVKAAALGLAHASLVHYSQNPDRWEGIAKKLRSKDGRYPKYADCSSYVTWALWNGLSVRFGVGDTVNGQSWKAGYTGTMLSQGKSVRSMDNWLLADLVLYGKVGQPSTQHVAMLVGDGWVISHGSEGGPYKVRWNYRADVIGVRRYI